MICSGFLDAIGSWVGNISLEKKSWKKLKVNFWVNSALIHAPKFITRQKKFRYENHQIEDIGFSPWPRKKFLYRFPSITKNNSLQRFYLIHASAIPNKTGNRFFEDWRWRLFRPTKSFDLDPFPAAVGLLANFHWFARPAQWTKKLCRSSPSWKSHWKKISPS